MAKEEGKTWYKSKTLWFNGLMVLAGTATLVTGQIEAGVTITIAGFLNMLLRSLTNQGLK